MLSSFYWLENLVFFNIFLGKFPECPTCACYLGDSAKVSQLDSLGLYL